MRLIVAIAAWSAYDRACEAFIPRLKSPLIDSAHVVQFSENAPGWAQKQKEGRTPVWGLFRTGDDGVEQLTAIHYGIMTEVQVLAWIESSNVH